MKYRDAPPRIFWCGVTHPTKMPLVQAEDGEPRRKILPSLLVVSRWSRLRCMKLLWFLDVVILWLFFFFFFLLLLLLLSLLLLLLAACCLLLVAACCLLLLGWQLRFSWSEFEWTSVCLDQHSKLPWAGNRGGVLKGEHGGLLTHLYAIPTVFWYFWGGWVAIILRLPSSFYLFTPTTTIPAFVSSLPWGSLWVPG